MAFQHDATRYIIITFKAKGEPLAPVGFKRELQDLTALRGLSLSACPFCQRAMHSLDDSDEASPLLTSHPQKRAEQDEDNTALAPLEEVGDQFCDEIRSGTWPI